MTTHWPDYVLNPQKGKSQVLTSQLLQHGLHSTSHIKTKPDLYRTIINYKSIQLKSTSDYVTCSLRLLAFLAKLVTINYVTNIRICIY